MALARFRPATDVLFVVDVQSPFVDVVDGRDRIIDRVAFLIATAKSLDVPIIVTEQAPERLGSTHPKLQALLPEEPEYAKTTFSAMGSWEAADRFRQLGRKHAILVGVETHICVCSTALDLLESGAQVTVCADAVGARSLEAHKLGMERIRDSGGGAAHTESVAYEWLGDSTHPKFKHVLGLVKSHPLT